jgi:hypothetical protein
LLLGLLVAPSAFAGPEACYALVNSFSPNDVNLAYQFVKDHGECIADFEDPAFQAVSGSLTALTLSGKLHAGQCTSLLDNKYTPVAQQVLAAADADVVGHYLGCGCAVADSGVAQKLKTLVEDVVSCAKSFDPVGTLSSGMEKAGESLGMSTLWGLASNEHNNNAGVGNGGAPTEAYDVADCPVTGIPITSMSTAWDGSALPPGQHVLNCNCPAPTRPYADSKFIDSAAVTFHSPTFTCLACPPGTAKDSYGNCSHCLNKSGPNGFETWDPNQAGTACVLASVDEFNLQGPALMEKAAAAGCPNQGSPKTIHCADPTAQQDCQAALPGHEGLCRLDLGEAVLANAQKILASVTTADSPCTLDGTTIACVHPLQQRHCLARKQEQADMQGDQVVAGIDCAALPSDAYDQLRVRANQVVTALNAGYPPSGASRTVQSPSLALGRVDNGLRAETPGGCGLRRDDPLVVVCAPGFRWDANAQRADAVYQALGSSQVACVPDDDDDGAELPCIEGAAAAATPSLRPRRVPAIRAVGNGGG